MGRFGAYVGREVASGLAAPFTNPIADGFGIADSGYGHVHSAWRGGRGVTRVAGEWWHGGSDRTNALAQLGIDFAALQNDLTAQVTTPSDRQWMIADVAPVFAAWQTFLSRLAGSKLAAYVTEWSVFETWIQRLTRLREMARARGLVLTSAEPVPLPMTVWERGAKGTGTDLDTWVALGKTAVFGAIAVTGVVGFFAIMRDLKNHGGSPK